MGVRLEIFCQNSESSEFLEVNRIGEELFKYLQQEEIEQAFDRANSPGNSSAKVQEVFLKKALELGFQSEKKSILEHSYHKS